MCCRNSTIRFPGACSKGEWWRVSYLITRKKVSEYILLSLAHGPVFIGPASRQRGETFLPSSAGTRAVANAAGSRRPGWCRPTPSNNRSHGPAEQWDSACRENVMVSKEMAHEHMSTPDWLLVLCSTQ